MSYPFARHINTSTLDLKQPRDSFPAAFPGLTPQKPTRFITALTWLEKGCLRHATHRSALRHRSTNSEGQRRLGTSGFICNGRLREHTRTQKSRRDREPCGHVKEHKGP